ncbi:tRNA adenosine(34) deaminase TadA [Buchnera aphidicola (Taiwanaphis decaspermi)]|uniref:tRNA adenosine(34) deaminase TadA n=1 Tax=Buchnera aphidicola TaxID=9 RepID=UPI0031B8B0A9
MGQKQKIIKIITIITLPNIKIMNKDIKWMSVALEQAKKAKNSNEIPVGSLLILSNIVIGSGYNLSIKQNDPTAHAEIITLRNAGKFIKNYRLLQTTLYVTLEPCLMCIGAIINSRIKKLVFGAYSYKKNKSIINILKLLNIKNKMKIKGGVLKNKCSSLLKNFFKGKRNIKN